ncbi:DciA family protein [Baaleninema simplex]|uniref:DciA family protein n=1 Tax=Baaleninema simplex TaxID=2862350 RepID=UPI000345B80F|nr:DUF721 domain-containing protein [Baaleninema simplex]
MSFESLERILSSLPGLSPSPEQQQLEEIDRLWSEVVGEAIARYSRPVRVSRQVLQVAVATPVWAQQLQFKRVRLLAALNARLSASFKDIRFSPALWHRRDAVSEPTPQFDLSQHPSQWQRSRSPSLSLSSRLPRATTPREAFDGWAKRLGDRTKGLPLCPQCGCPTPPGELQRWSICALCASRSFGEPENS